MKLIVTALALTLAALFAITAVNGRSAAAADPSPCSDCGKLNDPCPSPVICCPGLTCLSSSGGQPKCVER